MSVIYNQPQEYCFNCNNYKINFQIIINNAQQTLVYAEMINKQGQSVASVKVSTLLNHQLYVDIKDQQQMHYHKHNNINILLGRCIDRALRAENILRIVRIVILNAGTLQQNQNLCHLAIFFSIYRQARLSFVNNDQCLLSRNQTGIVALELTQDPSWSIQNKISIIYQQAQHFLNFLDDCFGKLQKSTKHKPQTIQQQSLEELINTCNDRAIINDWLVTNNQRIDNRSLEDFRNITIFIRKTNCVDFARGTTYISNTVHVENQKGDYSTLYCFPNGSMRRSIGHTNLVYKTIKPYINPSVKISSINEVVFSDGSSSMGSICAESLTLQRLGLLQYNIVGLSFGLFRAFNNKSVIICDLTAQEDQYSETDIKITANIKGFLTIQMDSKSHITLQELNKIFQLAKIKLKELIKYIEPYCSTNVITDLLPDKDIGAFIGRNKAHLLEIHKLLKTDNINVYGNSIVAINLTKSQKLQYKKMLTLFQDKKIGKKAIFQIKNINPLATVVGKIINSGKYNKFKSGNFVSGTIEKWDNKEKIIKIINNIS